MELTRELCERYDAVLCMTDSQSVSLAAHWPDLDERFMCLGGTDIEVPRIETQMAWNRLSDTMAGEINQLVLELLGPEEDDD